MKTLVRTMNRRQWPLALGAALALCLGLDVEPARAGEGSWMRRANMPAALFGAAGCEVDGILYVAGGASSFSATGIARTLFAYDPRTDMWTRKADMPTTRATPVAGAVDDIMYVIGGGNLPAGIYSAAVEAYDPKTDTWATKAPMPAGRQDMAACTLDGLIYVIGGFVKGQTKVATVECYDPKTDQWTRKADLPEACVASVAEATDGLIYVFDRRDVFVYDPQTNAWTRKPLIPAGLFSSHNSMASSVNGLVYLLGGLLESAGSYCAHALTVGYNPVAEEYAAKRMMPEPCSIAATATIGGKIYLAGGASGYAPTCAGTVIYDSLWVFDPKGSGAPGSWTKKADVPVAVGAAAACEANGIFYLAGGGSSPGKIVGTLYAYDPQTDGWTAEKDMPTARAGAVAAAVEGIVYVIGGGDDLTWTMTNTVEAYDPATDTWTTKTPMPTRRGDMAGCALDGLIYVIGGLMDENTWTAKVECYDPKTDKWTQKASLPVTSAAAVAQALDGLIYLFDPYRETTRSYDPKTDLWTPVGTLPGTMLSRGNASAGTVDGVTYLFGGLQGSQVCGSDLVLAYDPVQNRLTSRRMLPQPWAVSGAAAIDGKVYLAGGFSGNPMICPGTIYYKSLWVFDPEGGVAPYILSFTHQSDDTVKLKWQGEAGRLYGVKYAVHPKGPWITFRFSDGSTTIRATKAVVEATGPLTPVHPARYFRVFEAD